MGSEDIRKNRILRHLNIADTYLRSGGRLDKQKFTSLLEEAADDFGLSGCLEQKLQNNEIYRQGKKISYVNQAWPKLVERIKEEAALKGELFDLIEINTGGHRISQSVRYKVPGFSLFPLADRTARRIAKKYNPDKLLRRIDLSNVTLDNVDSVLAREFYASDDKNYTQTKRKLIKLKFDYEMGRLLELEKSGGNNVMDVFNRYDSLLSSQYSLADSDRASLLAQYAQFVAANWRHHTAFGNDDIARNWDMEIRNSFEKAISLTADTPKFIIENTVYLRYYLEYLLCRNYNSDNYNKQLVYKLIANIPGLDDGVFKVECLISAGKYLYKHCEKELSKHLFQRAGDILTCLSATDFSVVIKSVELHSIIAETYLSEGKVPEAFGEFDIACQLINNLSVDVRKTNLHDFDHIFNRYESSLRECGLTDLAISILQQRLDYSIEANDTTTYRTTTQRLLYDWTKQLYVNQCFRNNIDKCRNYVLHIYEHCPSLWMDEQLKCLGLFSELRSIENRDSELTYSEAVHKADLLCRLAEIINIIFCGEYEISVVVESIYREALSLYNKYSSSEMRCLISELQTKITIAELHRKSDKDFVSVEKEYMDLISSFDNLPNVPFVRLMHLSVLNYFGVYSRWQPVDAHVFGLIHMKANKIISNIGLPYKVWDEKDLVDKLLFSCGGYLKNESDMDYYKSLVSPNGNCEYVYVRYFMELINSHINSVQYLCLQNEQSILTDEQLIHNLNQLIDSFFNSESPLLEFFHWSDLHSFFARFVEAFPSDSTKVKARIMLKNILRKCTHTPERYIPLLPRNKISELKDYIKFYGTYDVDMECLEINHRTELAELYLDLGLKRQAKQEYLHVLKDIDVYKNITGQTDTYNIIEREVNEALYKIYLGTKRYRIALTYLDATIAIYEKLRIADKTYHATVKRLRQERMDLDDLIYGK